MDEARLVTLEGVHNFRDVGGYPTADGRAVRWGLIYRADGLGRLTANDIETLRPLGLRTVIDLRTDAELVQRGRFPHESYQVNFHHLPILDATWAHDQPTPPDQDATGFLLDAYRQMLDAGPDRLAAALRVLALPGSLPAVFHCAAGKDRTGILAALLLGAVGVTNEHVVNDYALTGEAIARMREWAAEHDPSMAAAMASAPAIYMSAEPRAMELLLDGIVAEHGSVREYVHRLGVSSLELDWLTDALLT